MKRFSLLLLLLCSLLFVKISRCQDSQSMLKQLESCEIELNIKGTSKYDAADERLAKKYEGVELIWIHLDKQSKKTDSLNPIRVYLISEKMRNGLSVEYIIPKADKEAGVNAPIFPEWKSKKNRFFTAECFDKIYKS